MRKIKETLLEEHPITDTFRVMFDELAEYCKEVLEIKERLSRIDRSSEEFYRLMARLDTLLMGIGLTAKHLRNESERMDEMFEQDW
ncbi:MAG TPA: hypothetical protein VJZ26_07785 [Blastocatellia bacterium]|nr:hypothetical protein [Blastocatellia bacterium]